MSQDERPVEDLVRYQVDSGVARITIDRPEAGNALTTQMRDRLAELFESVSGTLAVRAVLLSGTGRAFCTGADLRGSRAAAPPIPGNEPPPDAPERSALFSSARALGLWALHPNRAYLTEELVRDAHREGLRVNVWTVDDEAQIRLFAGWGVDGIMSDYPERIPKT